MTEEESKKEFTPIFVRVPNSQPLGLKDSVGDALAGLVKDDGMSLSVKFGDLKMDYIGKSTHMSLAGAVMLEILDRIEEWRSEKEDHYEKDKAEKATHDMSYH